MQWACVICEYREACTVEPKLCGRCGACDTFAPLELEVKKPRRARELLNSTHYERIPTGDANLDILLEGGFVRGHTVLVWGKGGSGKSRVCLRWASMMPGLAGVISLEMADSLAAFAADSAGADIDNLDISETLLTPTPAYRTLVLDSISVMPDKQAASVCAELTTWAKQTGGIAFVICHITKGGDLAGRGWLEHWPDYVLRVSQARKVRGARIRVMKSRFSPCETCVVPLVGETPPVPEE